MNHQQSRDRSGVAAHLPFALVVVVVLAGLVRVAQYHWREGTFVIGVALLLAAGLRVLLTDEQAGLIAIRSRPVDVLLYSGLGLAIIWVTLTIVGGPLH